MMNVPTACFEFCESSEVVLSGEFRNPAEFARDCVQRVLGVSHAIMVCYTVGDDYRFIGVSSPSELSSHTRCHGESVLTLLTQTLNEAIGMDVHAFRIIHYVAPSICHDNSRFDQDMMTELKAFSMNVRSKYSPALSYIAIDDVQMANRRIS